MRKAYDKELKDLHRTFTQLGTLVNEAIYKSIKALVNHDKKLAIEVIDNDETINQIEVELERKCIEVIALQQPVTADLRRIIAILKASADLERMGDHAVSISKSTIRVKGSKRSTELEGIIANAGEKIKVMVNDILDAFVDLNADKALEVAARDEEIDELTGQLKGRSIERMMGDPDIIYGATDYTLVGGSIERIGDYVTNIAEWIVYYETGVIKELNISHDYADIVGLEDIENPDDSDK